MASTPSAGRRDPDPDQSPGRPPSETALTAAAARAAHLIVDHEPYIFADPLAYPLLGDRAEELVGYHRRHGDHIVLAGSRAIATVRSRYTEDRLAEAAVRGIRQYVILGAGLDSFAYRRTDATAPLRTFEVDHPATQEWKRQRLADAGIGVPETVSFVPVDFESDAFESGDFESGALDGSLIGHLTRAGFDASRPALISWLGVTMYLTRDAIEATLAAIGGLAPGTELVMEHMAPEELRDADGQTYVDLVTPIAAQRGEPWLTYLGPADVTTLFDTYRLDVVARIGLRDAIDAALWHRSDAVRAFALPYIAHGTVRGPGRP